MKTHRFWEVLEETVTGADGKRYALRAWGGSDIDRGDAMAAAMVRLAQMQAAAQARSGLKQAILYEYGTGVVREEVLAVLAGPAQAPEAVITRNRYGAPVLNARRLFIADIDVGEARPSLKFWAKPVDPAIAALDVVRKWTAANDASVRAYRTPNGLRVIRTDRAVDAESDAAMADLAALDSDRLYRALCRRQQCFRARLGPKPWRAGLSAPPGNFPRDAAAQATFGDWLAEYEQAARDHAACRFVETIGSASPAPELAPLVQVHDEQSGALSGRDLA
jgi:hypothetical protein